MFTWNSRRQLERGRKTWTDIKGFASSCVEPQQVIRLKNFRAGVLFPAPQSAPHGSVPGRKPNTTPTRGVGGGRGRSLRKSYKKSLDEWQKVSKLARRAHVRLFPLKKKTHTQHRVRENARSTEQILQTLRLPLSPPAVPLPPSLSLSLSLSPSHTLLPAKHYSRKRKRTHTCQRHKWPGVNSNR